MTKDKKISLAIIGGSGLYRMPGLDDVREYALDTPFGPPSAPVVVGVLEGKQVAFLARHGIGHHFSPAQVNYRANIYTLKQLGVERIIGINACGSLREDYAPGHIVIPDQVLDFTHDRPRTFFSDGLVAHIGSADPFCPQLSSLAAAAARAAGAEVHEGGTFIVIDGPRFSTKAESNVFRAWGMSLVGMTCAPEVFLAREAEMCYTVMAHVTDYDVWHVNETSVTVEMVVQTLARNTSTAQDAVRRLVRNLPEAHTCTCDSALADALITDPAVIPPEIQARLDLLIRKYIH